MGSRAHEIRHRLSTSAGDKSPNINRLHSGVHIPEDAELERGEADNPGLQPNYPEERTDLPDGFWALYVDGSSNMSGTGAGLILVNPKEIIMEYALHFKFSVTNNRAEYEALIVGLKIAKELEVDRLQVYSDSQLVVG